MILTFFYEAFHFVSEFSKKFVKVDVDKKKIKCGFGKRFYINFRCKASTIIKNPTSNLLTVFKINIKTEINSQEKIFFPHSEHQKRILWSTFKIMSDHGDKLFNEQIFRIILR